MIKYSRWSLVLVLVVFAAGVRGFPGDHAQELAEPDDAVASSGLQVRYADARLRLALADLEKAMGANRQIAGIVSETEMHRLGKNLQVARRQLSLAREYSHGSTKPTQASAAEAEIAIAKRRLTSALLTNKDRPETVREIDIRRYRIMLELAELRFELWSDPDHLPSLIDQMQWQIDRLTDQIIQFNEQMLDLSQE